jgi:aspartate racemase
MKTAGLLGGMSWESTVPYYQVLNREVGKRLGGLHSARIVLLSVDFQDIEALQHQGRWDQLGTMLAREARTLETAGADFLVLCTNTMHLVAPAIERAIEIPLLHIADATAERIKKAGLGTIGLLGTRFTMEERFYVGRLQHLHGLDVLVPGPEDREIVHGIIYQELVKGEILPDSRASYLEVVGALQERGAEGIILGCTEIGLLLRDGDTEVPLFDTALIHAEAAAEYAFGHETGGRQERS